MRYMDAIEKRQSVRNFQSKELSVNQIYLLEDFFKEVPHLVDGIATEMVIMGDTTGVRLEGVAGYEGHCFNAPNYVFILSEKKDGYLENAGFITENVVLKLVSMGLGNVWLTVNNSDFVKKAVRIHSDKEVVSILACGYAKRQIGGHRLDIKNPSNVVFTQRKGYAAPKIALSELVYQDTWGNSKDLSENAVDPQMEKAFYAASLAPSFFNRQMYRFVVIGNRIIACGQMEEIVAEDDSRLDMGAALFHFYIIYHEYTHMKGCWKLGIPEGLGDFGKPESFDIVAYYDF